MYDAFCFFPVIYSKPLCRILENMRLTSFPLIIITLNLAEILGSIKEKINIKRKTNVSCYLSTQRTQYA